MALFLLSGAALGAVPAYANAPTAAVTAPSYSVTLTAYNAVPGQTDSDPSETASGAYSNPEVIAARSRDLADELPFGTIIAITGPSAQGGSCGYGAVAPIIGYRVIEDTMASSTRFSNHVDILFSTKSNYVMGDGSTKNAANILGICPSASIRVVGHVSLANIPKTQDDLAALVNGTGSPLAAK